MNAPFRPPTWTSATQSDPLAAVIGIAAWSGGMLALWIGGLWWALS